MKSFSCNPPHSSIALKKNEMNLSREAFTCMEAGILLNRYLKDRLHPSSFNTSTSITPTSTTTTMESSSTPSSASAPPALPISLCYIIACQIVHLTGQEREFVYSEIWTTDFITHLLEYILYAYPSWSVLLVVLGNTTAYPVKEISLRLLQNKFFLSILEDFLSGKSERALIPLEIHDNAQEASAWIIANLLQSNEDELPKELFTFIPLFMKHISNPEIWKLMNKTKKANKEANHQQEQQQQQALSDQEELQGGVEDVDSDDDSDIDTNDGNNDGSIANQTRRLQLSFRSFRCLCALFSIPSNRMIYSKEYSFFLEILQIHSPSSSNPFLSLLFHEFSVGLEGKRLPGTSYYPEPFIRALTVLYLTKFQIGREALIKNSFQALLVKSLTLKYHQSEKETSILWSRAIKAIHNLVSATNPIMTGMTEGTRLTVRDHQQEEEKYHQDLLAYPMIQGLIPLAGQRYGNTYSSSSGEEEEEESTKTGNFCLPFKIRRLAADAAIALRLEWKIERLFWIALKKKQNPNCYISKLPYELIRMIMMWVLLLDAYDMDEGESLSYHMKEITLGYKQKA